MSEPALRAFAVAGVLTASLLIGGFAAAPVIAQPSDSGGSSQDSGDTSGGASGGTDSGTGPTAASKPNETAGTTEGGSAADTSAPADDSRTGSVDTSTPEESGGRVSSRTAEPDIAPPVKESQKTGYSNSITLPFVRLPARGEIPFGSLPSPSTFYTTIEIPVPTLSEFLSALSIVPPPPPPGPSFRTQEEAPVIDATTGTAGGGGPAAGAVSEPSVFRAPLVVTVPRAITIAGASPKDAGGVPVGGPAQPGATPPGVAGANTPVIRGSLAPTPGASAKPVGRLETPRAEAMPRVVANPTLAQIAAVALPGVAGLIFLTFSGGVIGYRQANSVRFVRTAGAERFLP